jgi:hypothetical protein
MTISRLRPRREFAGVRWLRYMAYRYCRRINGATPSRRLGCIALRDPPQLSCLLVGELPGFPDERRLRDRRPSIDLLWEMLAMKLSRVRRLIVRHGVPRSRQANHDLTTLHLDVKVVGGSPASR